jgi:hypothetical protein
VGKVYDEIDEGLRAFIEAQHVFFVATAPLAADGHVNVSPKGLDTLRVLDARTVAYLDCIGSGAETLAHLHGRGRAVEPGDAEFAALRAQFPDSGPARSIVLVTVERCSGSCGFAVPLLRYEGERTHMTEWAARKGAEGLAQYQREKNHHSIDGLPALRWTSP